MCTHTVECVYSVHGTRSNSLTTIKGTWQSEHCSEKQLKQLQEGERAGPHSASRLSLASTTLACFSLTFVSTVDRQDKLSAMRLSSVSVLSLLVLILPYNLATADCFNNCTHLVVTDGYLISAQEKTFIGSNWSAIQVL